MNQYLAPILLLPLMLLLYLVGRVVLVVAVVGSWIVNKIRGNAGLSPFGTDEEEDAKKNL